MSLYDFKLESLCWVGKESKRGGNCIPIMLSEKCNILSGNYGRVRV